jgi:hypothetical protein
MTSWRSKHVADHSSTINEWWYIIYRLVFVYIHRHYCCVDGSICHIVINCEILCSVWPIKYGYIPTPHLQSIPDRRQPHHLGSQLSSTAIQCTLYICQTGSVFHSVFHFLSWSWSTRELGPAAIYDQHLKLIVLCTVPNFIHILNYQKLYSGENVNWFEVVQIPAQT